MEKKDDDDRNRLRIVPAGQATGSHPTSSSVFEDDTEAVIVGRTASSLGFMDMLVGPSFHDYSSAEGSASLFDLLQQPAAAPPLPLRAAGSFHPREDQRKMETSPSSTVALSSNSSLVSLSSTDGGNEEKTEEDEQSQSLDEDDKSKKAQWKAKKNNNQKNLRQPRFAFMTKSEVDRLDDGYRWRKYGQKAIKNSPFPRSYYRCTRGGCGVKKRVERSDDDASVVVTTYEGQHNHVSPATPRGSVGFRPDAAALGTTAPIQPSFLYPSLSSPLLSGLCEDRKQFGSTLPNSSSTPNATTASASLMARDQGLLQDIISSSQMGEDPKRE